uniref:Rho GTPase-activating protein 32 n=1 Tax=Gouania willdenowi TaxID=441366 RepID=A0A8C5N2X2_GOUWI
MARSAELPELRAEPLSRSCSSSTASMKVKNVKKLSFTKGHFPKLAECAHFHYENVDFGSIQLSLGDDHSDVNRTSCESKDLVYLVHIYCQGRSWTLRRSYDDFRVLDKHLHLCIYDRGFSQLPELPRPDSVTDQSESVSQMLLAYLSRLSSIADNKINCGPALTWMEVDNKGNHLLVHEESSINVPAIAAAHVIKRYIAQASDELSFEVGDIVSVIDMPPKEDTTWWRGKNGFQVGFFPSECVELINDKVPQSVTNCVPKPVSKKHGKLITFLRSFMKSRPSKQKLKQRGILRERVFGCDLGEHLLNSAHDVPQVLKSCTEFIEKHGVVDGMYRLSGVASNIQKLRHEFDSEQVPDLTKDVYIQDIHCVGSLCKLYFRELPNPLLTYQLYDKFSEAVSAATDEERLIKIHDVIQQLPPPHYRTLEFLMRHLSHLAAFSYITNMHSKNLAIVWAPNLLRSKQIESACFSGTAAFMEVRIQSVVVEFILNHVEVLFSSKLSSLIREGAGHNSLSRPKSLLVSSPSTKLLSLEEAQARTQAQINSPVTEDSKYIEVGEGPAALQGKFHTVIEFPTERKRPPIKSKKSPVGSWRSFFSLGKSSSMSKRKLQRNPSEPSELKAMALTGGRGDVATLRSAKSEESLSSLHNVEGKCFHTFSNLYRPRRPRSSSDALSTSFNGDLLENRPHCSSYHNLDVTPHSDGEEGPICVPALISPPRSAGEDVDLSPPDIGMASLDFDPMSFQCSFPLDETLVGAEAPALRRSPVCRRFNGLDRIASPFVGSLTYPMIVFSVPAGIKAPDVSKDLPPTPLSPKAPPCTLAAPPADLPQEEDHLQDLVPDYQTGSHDLAVLQQPLPSKQCSPPSPPDTPLHLSPPLSSPIRTSPQRPHPLSSTSTRGSTPSVSCKDTSFPPEPEPEVTIYTPVLIESSAAYYHRRPPRPVSLGPQSFPHHYQADAPPTHPYPYVSKSEPQIPHKYSTLGPRSYHHSMKSRGTPRGGYLSPGAGPQSYSHSRNQGYPTIRRVHSLHVPSSVRSVPVQRTEVPPDDDMFFYHLPLFSCKAYQQPYHQPPSQADYHVTQLQPFFENGRVQYRYSPYCGSGPLDAPFCDIQPYGTIRVRHLHSHSSRDSSATLGRQGAKAGSYHYLTRSGLPRGPEHSFVSRDVPPAHGTKESVAAHPSWDPEESEKLRVQSIRRESRARMKVRGPILSQYDNVALFTPSDVSTYETLHLRSKSDPGKAVLVPVESRDGRFLPRSDGSTYLATDKHSQSDRSDGLSHQNLSRSQDRDQDFPTNRSFPPHYQCSNQSHFKTLSSFHSGDEPPSVPMEPQSHPHSERSHSARDPSHFSQNREFCYQKVCTPQSHYDNLDDYHPVAPPPPPVPKRAGPTPHNNNNNRAYSTALGQGAFIQTELGLQRPDAEVRTE